MRVLRVIRSRKARMNELCVAPCPANPAKGGRAECREIGRVRTGAEHEIAAGADPGRGQPGQFLVGAQASVERGFRRSERGRIANDEVECRAVFAERGKTVERVALARLEPVGQTACAGSRFGQVQGGRGCIYRQSAARAPCKRG